MTGQTSTLDRLLGSLLGKDFSMTADGGLFVDNELLARMMEDLSPEQREIFEREAIGKTYPTSIYCQP
jgi:hypothetical protein